jgi:hypothetical protein
MSLAATSSYYTTKDVSNPHRRMTPNKVLNAFYQGLLDEHGVLGEEGKYIDDSGAVDDDKLEVYTSRQEAEHEIKRNLLLKSINIVELEDQEQSVFDAVDLRRHREQFCRRTIRNYLNARHAVVLYWRSY